MLLTIGISTNKSEISSLLKYIIGMSEELSSLRIAVVIGLQGGALVPPILPNWLRVVRVELRGLSNNRNAVIDACETKWIWFQDDDIRLSGEGLRGLVSSLDLANEDIAFVRVKSLEGENNTGLYKSYDFHQTHTWLNCNKISSIEIVVRAQFLRANSIRFNPKLGLGTALPCCEENLFVMEAFSKNASFIYLKCAPCFHTINPELRIKVSRAHYEAKGAYLRRLPLLYSLPLMMRWSVRAHKNEVGIYAAMKSILRGFFINID
jgi:glycosyltransferase involved in cell wall biosynthesis